MSTSNKKTKRGVHALPHLLEPNPGPWVMEEVALENSRVDIIARIAQLPKPNTPAQQMARIHEMLHIMYTPKDLRDRRNTLLNQAEDEGKRINSNFLMDILLKLEETRVDWIGWAYHGYDLRACREALAWGTKPVPDDDIKSCTSWILQLFWTVLGSTTVPPLVDEGPDIRTPDPDTKEFFDSCWQAVAAEKGEAFLRALVQAGLQICHEPTNAVRDKLAYELACWFEEPPPDEEPEESEEEKEAQDEAEQEEEEEEAKEEEEKSGGINNEVEVYDTWELHDHTLGLRRPSSKFRQLWKPQDMGTIMRYPQRWLLDRNVFGRKVTTQAAVLVDLSSSMQWNNDDLEHMLAKLPALWCGGYSSVRAKYGSTVQGRLCIYAKNGRFNEFTGIDPEMSGGNDIDLEALQYLARLPGYKFWVSDGHTCGGVHQGKPHPDITNTWTATYSVLHNMTAVGYLYHECTRVMKRAGILRIPNAQVMRDLIDGKRITAYRSVVMGEEELDATVARYAEWASRVANPREQILKDFYGGLMSSEPVKIQL